ncbi:MAG TPA: hypothetical protein VEJ18_09950 [Planctomycetota bacterium]|nr:hypothetical protein [Planctomycetota bacterium]
MKTSAAIAVVLALLAGFALAQQAQKPINRKCPLKPDVRIDPMQTVVHNGKVIGLCCSDCTEKFKRNPGQYMSAVKADAHLPVEPEGYVDAKSALDAGKSGNYLVAVLFADKAGKASILGALSHPSLEEELASIAYAKVEFKKDAEEAKALKVTSPGTLVLVDARGETPKVLKSLTSATPATLLKEIQNARKEMEK